MALKVVFAGTPEFAKPVLEVLLKSEHQVIAVYTRPDRPAGRGQKLHASPIKELALRYALPIYQPESLRDEQDLQHMRDLAPDVIVVVGYGMLLPEAVLQIPRFGCINVHPSLLPRWRGSTPVQSAILAGDTKTGVAVMQLDKGMDSGDILNMIETPVGDDETSGELYERLFKLGADLLLKTLDQAEHHQLQPQKQAATRVTLARKIKKADAEIDWALPAQTLFNKVRAFNPWPVAFTYFKEQPLKIWRAKVINEKTPLAPSVIANVTKSELDIATGEGLLRLLKVQLPGKRPVPIKDFLNAFKKDLVVGKQLFSRKE